MADGLEILQLKLYLYEFSNVLARLNSTLFLLKAKWNLLFHFSMETLRERHHQFDAVVDPRLVIDRRDIVFDRAFGDKEFIRDLPVA